MNIWVYVLRSCKDARLYIGITNNLKDRIKRHNQGRVRSTKGRIPFVLVHEEECSNYEQAREREKFFKSGQGRIFLQRIVR